MMGRQENDIKIQNLPCAPHLVFNELLLSRPDEREIPCEGTLRVRPRWAKMAPANNSSKRSEHTLEEKIEVVSTRSAKQHYSKVLSDKVMAMWQAPVTCSL